MPSRIPQRHCPQVPSRSRCRRRCRCRSCLCYCVKHLRHYSPISCWRSKRCSALPRMSYQRRAQDGGLAMQLRILVNRCGCVCLQTACTPAAAALPHLWYAHWLLLLSSCQLWLEDAGTEQMAPLVLNINRKERLLRSHFSLAVTISECCALKAILKWDASFCYDYVFTYLCVHVCMSVFEFP